MQSGFRKNVDLVLHDIRQPISRRASTDNKGSRAREPFSYKIFFLAFITTVALVGLGYSVFTYPVTHQAIFKDYADTRADSNLEKWDEEEKSLFSSLENLKDYMGAIFGITSNLSQLKKRGVGLAFDGGGEELVRILRELEEDLNTLDRVGASTKSFVGSLVTVPGFEGGFGDVANTVGGLADLLEKPGGGRLVLLFENHSEIRPSGGFVGSYGIVTFENGNIVDISVDDIYTPDRDTEVRVVPPRQLQSITGDWGARDANWFFDFPTSAEKALYFLEASNVYVHDEIEFDGVVALNSNVVSDVLEIIGGVEIEEHGVELTGENFLTAVRSDVELQREDWEPGDNPKEILSLAMPIILEKIKGASGEEKKDIFLALMSRGANKDLKIYFKDEDLQEVVHRIGLDGAVYDLPEDFVGDYLAVVNANVAGGKSDLFIEQDVELVSQVSLDGRVENRLKIVRQHLGDGEAEALYRADDQNFIKVFAGPHAVLEDIEGVTPKTVRASVNYEEEGYEVDKDLERVESSRESWGDDVGLYRESGKNVFAAWFSTPSGERRELTLDYEAEKDVSVESGSRFTFVYEKQSGVESNLDYKVLAPEGFIWKESGSNVFSYKSEAVLGRLIIELTLLES